MRSAGVSECSWQDNIELGLEETGCGDMDWIYLARDKAH
jgi:hypothetical protein